MTQDTYTNVSKYARTRLFEAPSGGNWTQVTNDKWKLENCKPVFRQPQSTWKVSPGPTKTIWFIPEMFGADSSIDPNDLEFPKWMLCIWSTQAGRWIVGHDDPVTKLALVMAPVNGIPARVGATPGSATCEKVEVATSAGTGYAIGDLVKFDSVTIKNWSFEIAAADGDRIAQVEGHFDDAMVVGWICENAGDPLDIKVR